MGVVDRDESPFSNEVLRFIYHKSFHIFHLSLVRAGTSCPSLPERSNLEQKHSTLNVMTNKKCEKIYGKFSVLTIHITSLLARVI